jgi:hypothetical protein
MRESDKLAAFRNREQRRELVCLASLVLTPAAAVLTVLFHVDSSLLALVARAIGKL